MRLYNQTKHNLSWKIDGVQYECEAWGPIRIPDELLYAIKSRGLPLDVTPVAPEHRAQARIADQEESDREKPLLALKKAADEAQANERSAKQEVERLQVELGAANDTVRELRDIVTVAREECNRLTGEKVAAESLLSEAGKRATDAEERAIKAEALLAELQKEPASQTKADKPDPKKKSDKPATTE
jgi:hypothetical protein